MRIGIGRLRLQYLTGPDIFTGGAPMMHARARTYLDRDQLYDQQIPIAVDAVKGEARIGDSFLLPMPLRRIVREGDKLGAMVWNLRNNRLIESNGRRDRAPDLFGGREGPD